MPVFIAWQDHETEPILIIEDLSGADWPPPWTARGIDQVRAQIEAMHATKAAVPRFADLHAHWGGNWAHVAADPVPFLALGLADEAWLTRALPALLAAESACSTAGPALTHMDLRSDNLCFTSSGAKFVDWPEACLSNPRLDLGFWLPGLTYEGGPPPEQVLPDAPEVAAFVAGFFASRAGRPRIPDAPRVRTVQRQQLSTALPWAVRALDLPRLP